MIGFLTGLYVFDLFEYCLSISNYIALGLPLSTVPLLLGGLALLDYESLLIEILSFLLGEMTLDISEEVAKESFSEVKT